MNEFLNDSEQSPERKIGIGSIVTLHFIDEPDEVVETFLVVSGNEPSDIENNHLKVSMSSPVGAAILGAKAGDIKEFSVPAQYPQQINRVRIMSVE